MVPLLTAPVWVCHHSDLLGLLPYVEARLPQVLKLAGASQLPENWAVTGRISTICPPEQPGVMVGVGVGVLQTPKAESVKGWR
jgi:hypothetical protein